MEENLSFNAIRESFSIGEVDIKTYSPLNLACIGDCVFDMYIRTYLVAQGNTKVESLHKKKSALVNAGAQAEAIESFMDRLSEEELDIYKRGKNAKPKSHAKNAALSDYNKATGFEALLGYLYIQGKQDRIMEIVKWAIEKN